MTKRSVLLVLGASALTVAVGCSGSSTDVSKASNDAYHEHQAGSRPPPGVGPKAPPAGAMNGAPAGASGATTGATH